MTRITGQVTIGAPVEEVLASLEAFGFPPPGHPYWTPETLAGMALRYPDLDLSPWRTA